MSPLPASKWNYAAAAHLLNRAGFGGTPDEVQKLLKLGLDGAVSYFVDYEKIPDDTAPPEWAKPDPRRADYQRQLQDLNRQERAAPTEEEKTKIAGQRRELQQQLQREMTLQLLQMRAAWIERMVTGPRPLQEKLTLFWHGHFATSIVKVREIYFMWRQIQTFRQLASANWRDLLESVATDRPCSSGWTRRKAARNIPTRISRANPWNCSPWAKATTPRRTSPKPPAP